MGIGIAPNEEKMVDFETYCKKCKYKDDNPDDESSPCDECLDNPTNQYSKKPIKFKEKNDE